MHSQFRCLMTREKSDQPQLHSTTVSLAELPPGDVLIEIEYSSLNYKDALASQGHPGVAKTLPHVPGIDGAGRVVDSSHAGLQVGDQVLVTGYDFGQGRWGGWSEFVRVPAEWVVRIPAGLTPREAMTIGTAGFTAAQCVLALRRNEVLPHCGEIAVTGATGGVGLFAVSLLAQLGYSVVAVTGKPDESQRLFDAGAKSVVHRSEVTDESQRPLLSARWAGAVDTVGGQILNSLLRTTKYGGCVTACGLVAGPELDMTLYPFLLRGVALCGIASADCPRERRLHIWNLLADQWKLTNLNTLATEIELDQTPEFVDRILAGKNIGRTIIRLG